MKFIPSITLFLFLACKSQVDANSIELREHGLSYIKGTNELVTGEAIRKLEGKISEVQSYQNGKMIGPFAQYGPRGEILSSGFGSELKNDEKSLDNTDLSNCILSIIHVNNAFYSATLYMDNTKLFYNQERIVKLSKMIYSDYDKCPFDYLLIFDNSHEYAVSKNIRFKPMYVVDTIPDPKKLKLDFH